MRCFALVVLAWSLAACSQPPRDNPLDPGGTSTGPALPSALVETSIEENLIIVPNLFVNAPIVEIQ